MGRALKRGTVVLANLDPTLGHEQRALRPCVVVTDPAVTAHQRYELCAIVPLTSKPQVDSLYPVVEPDPLAGVRLRSYSLTDQLRPHRQATHPILCPETPGSGCARVRSSTSYAARPLKTCELCAVLSDQDQPAAGTGARLLLLTLEENAQFSNSQTVGAFIGFNPASFSDLSFSPDSY
jgi:mRNA-degrading endonuclease toxin of MazEF toxin-antitoxin module